MKNSLTDVRNHLIAQLETLQNLDLTGDNLKQEIERGQAMSEIARTLVESAKVEVAFISTVSRSEAPIRGTGFLSLTDSVQ